MQPYAECVSLPSLTNPRVGCFLGRWELNVKNLDFLFRQAKLTNCVQARERFILAAMRAVGVRNQKAINVIF
jgi:hypothetical protein